LENHYYPTATFVLEGILAQFGLALSEIILVFYPLPNFKRGINKYNNKNTMGDELLLPSNQELYTRAT